jgi:hypothetical protein
MIMSADQAREVLRAATSDQDGTFTLLRLGEDPGASRVHELRLALRVLWRHWMVADALPRDIAAAAAIILHFHFEGARNIAESRRSRSALGDELSDLEMGAFELLSGPMAETWTVRRPDLGE